MAPAAPAEVIVVRVVHDTGGVALTTSVAADQKGPS
jgi:hypothetical protein